MGSIRILREADVRSLLGMAACIDACERAFARAATGGAEAPAVIHLDVPEAGGEIHVKAGHLHGEPFYAVKVASGFEHPDGSVIDGLVMVFDATNGAPRAFLVDGGYITDLRTGAAGGVAARHLAPDHVEIVAVIGTGAQARQQVDALAVVRGGFSQVRVWGRARDRAERCAGDLRAAHGEACAVNAVATVDEAIEGAGVVITCTAASEPLVRADRLLGGVHVTAVGSDGPGKQELDPQILRRADVLAVDSLAQCRSLGELQHAPDQAERAVELGAICAGTSPGRTHPGQLTVCDLTGVGVQDVAAANVVMASLARSPLGDTIEV